MRKIATEKSKTDEKKKKQCGQEQRTVVVGGGGVGREIERMEERVIVHTVGFYGHPVSPLCGDIFHNQGKISRISTLERPPLQHQHEVPFSKGTDSRDFKLLAFLLNFPQPTIRRPLIDSLRYFCKRGFAFMVLLSSLNKQCH